jgi:acetoin utilization deacetylase AcuC-like enzyme
MREWVARADAHGRPLDVRPGLVVSGATWEASTAAVGCVLTAIDSVAGGESRNAFCAVRPPARDATPDEPGRRGLLNPVAIAVQYLLDRGVAERVLLVEWGEIPMPDSILAGGRARVARIEGLAADADDARFATACRVSLESALSDGFEPDFVLLSAGFDWVAGDPESGRALSSRAFHDATEQVVTVAEDLCGGRLVSVLEGGYDGRGLGQCTVQHLRGLARLQHA